MAAATIKLFLPKGEAQSLRTAELVNWSGKAIAGPRSELDDLFARPELSKAGVYLLTGVDSNSGKETAYIGEAEVVRDRLKQQREKDFWVQVIVFGGKDENLTKSHIRYLEGRLIDEAQKVGRFVIINGQSSGAALPESDREDMEGFLSRIRQLLPVLGCDILVPKVQPARGKNAEELFCKRKGVTARGQRSPKGFVIFKGSEAVAGLRPSAMDSGWITGLRDKLMKDGILAGSGDKLTFAQDYEFSSPSAASAVVEGGHSNGLSAWKTADGKTLKELEATA